MINNNLVSYYDDAELFIKYTNTHEISVRDKLFENNIRLVAYIINKYYSRTHEHQRNRNDLLQEGEIGLLSAIEKYDPSLGFKFSTYATYWIHQAINTFLTKNKTLVHVPSNINTLRNKLYKATKQENVNVDGNEYSPLVLRRIFLATNAGHVCSLDEPVSSSLNHKKINIGSTLSEAGPNPEEQTAHSLVVNKAKEVFNELSEREQLALLLRYDIIQEVSKNWRKK